MYKKITILMAAFLLIFSYAGLAQVVSGTTYSTPSVENLPTGWSGNDGGGTSYIKLIAADHYIQTASFEQNGFTSITIKARKFGGPSATQAKISVSWYDSENEETVLGTIDPANTTLTNYTISNPATTENGTGYIKIQNKDASSSKGSGVSEVTITYVVPGGTQPTTYTVTYHANVTGIDDVVDTYNEGANVTLRAANTFTNEGYTFEEWNTQADGDGDSYAGGDEIENIQENLEFYAIWTENTPSDEQWVLTSLADLTEDDVFVIVGNNGSNYAMSNNNGAGSAPATVAVTIENETISGTVADNIQWTVSGNAIEGYTFYPNGSTETWLYCNTTAGSSSNNNMRVGTGNRKVFELNSNNYLVTKDSYTARYLSIYNDADWRGYINTNLCPVISFYKKVTGGVLPPSISAENVDIAYDATSGAIEYTINNGVDGGTMTAVTESDWLNLGQGTASPISFTCTANQAGTARTAIVTLSYSYNRETVTKDVTVTQAGDPNAVMTIAEVRAQGTGDVVTRGIVTSITGSNNKTAYIQDATAAIVVYGNFTAAVGDEIRVSGTLDDYNGLLEIKNPTVTVLSSGNTINPELMTVAEVVASTNQGWYIRIENAIVTAISGQNTTIAQGESTIVVRGISGVEIAVDDVISLNGNIGYYNGNQIANPTNVEVQAAPAVPSITIDPATVSVDAEEAQGTLDIFYENLTITEAGDFDIQYYNAQGEEIDEPDWISAEVNEKLLSKNDTTYTYYEVTYVIAANNGEARTAYFKVYAMDDETNLVYSNPVTISQEEYVAPQASITFDPDFLIFDAELHYDGTMPFTYENIIVESMQSFGLQFYTAEGEETGMPQWFYAMVTPRSNENNGEYQVSCAIMANEGEARSVYFKVYAFDADSIPVYSNLATVTQSALVFDYAVLPFVWEGGSSADFLALNGVTANGLGSDYASGNAPYLIKFDGTGDYIQVKTDSQPGKVTINVKMIGGSNTSTITIQGSSDGENFIDIEELTISGEQNDVLTLETTNDFGGNDRYVRMLFTKGSNVGVGAITIAKGNAPSITLTPDTFELEAVGPLNGMHLPSMMVSYHNFEITQASDFNYQFYNAEGEEQEMPEWILHSEVSPITDTSYQAICIVTANDGPARSAYFKVYAYDADSIPVYSNLVTFNQAGVPQQYTLTVEPFENLELITFVNDEMVMEADGEIQVNEGDHIMLSIVADEGYVIETLMVNGVNHVEDIDDEFTYTFEMPAEAVTISATAVEAPTPVGGDYVRITSLDQLTDGSKVIFAARFDDNATEYYAMSNTSSGKPTGVLFTSATADEDEVLPASIVDEEDSYYWTVGVSADGYTFTNANGELIGYSSSTNFATGGDNTEWSIESGTSVETAMVPNYTGFVITNVNNDGRAFALNTSHNFGPYAKSNMNNNSAGNYNFYLDLFVQNEAPTPTETYTLEITGYGDSEGGYYLIASPVASDVRPSAENGFLTDAYDLYWFDQTEDEEWRNYEAGEFDLVSGMGYLYASQEGTTLTFTGTPYDGDGSVSLVKDDEAQLKGWNLVGNPFGVPAYIDRDFYKMNPQTGAELIQSSGEIAVMQGIFVIANEDGENLTFTPEATDQSANLTLNLSQSRGVVIDRAIVRFGEGRQLPKFQLNPNNTKVYIPQGAEDFAVVRSNAQGEMPVNFKAQNNGTYTISVNTENLEANYLHLIDNMTGTNIDLLQTPSYTFEAKTTDYASRFRLVFNVTGVEENTTSTEPFAFFNGSEWVVSNMGEATLQVVDMLGRIVSSETVNGNATMTTANLGAGVYVMRLVNGENVKIQKIIIK